MKAVSRLWIFILLPLIGCQGPQDLFDHSYTVPVALQNKASPTPPPVQPQNVYCYRTLGATECYSRPFRRGNLRFLGYYGAPPSDQTMTDVPEETEPSNP